MYKSESEIYSDAISVLSQIADWGKFSDWKIMQENQPGVQALRDKTVILDKLYSVRYGWQGRSDRLGSGGELVHGEKWISEIAIKVSFFKKRQIQDAAAPFPSAADVAEFVCAYFNSGDGIEKFEQMGYQILPPRRVENPAFESSSPGWRRMPNFDFVLIVPQSVERAQEEVSGWDLTVKRV